MCQQIVVKIPDKKFHENLSGEFSRCSMRADRPINIKSSVLWILIRNVRTDDEVPDPRRERASNTW
jgi:hypothetical protein